MRGVLHRLDRIVSVISLVLWDPIRKRFSDSSMVWATVHDLEKILTFNQKKETLNKFADCLLSLIFSPDTDKMVYLIMI